MINFDNLAWLPCVSQSCRWVGTCQEWEYVWVRLLYSSQIGFSTSRAFDISEALWKHRRAVLFVGVLLKKRFLPTSYSPMDFFFFMSFLVYIRNNCSGARLNHCTQPMTQLYEAELQTWHEKETPRKPAGGSVTLLLTGRASCLVAFDHRGDAIFHSLVTHTESCHANSWHFKGTAYGVLSHGICPVVATHLGDSWKTAFTVTKCLWPAFNKCNPYM